MNLTEKVIVKSHKTVCVLGYVLFAVEFPDLLNIIFDTDYFGEWTLFISLIGFALLAIYGSSILKKEENNV